MTPGCWPLGLTSSAAPDSSFSEPLCLFIPLRPPLKLKMPLFLVLYPANSYPLFKAQQHYPLPWSKVLACPSPGKVSRPHSYALRPISSKSAWCFWHNLLPPQSEPGPDLPLSCPDPRPGTEWWRRPGGQPLTSPPHTHISWASPTPTTFFPTSFTWFQLTHCLNTQREVRPGGNCLTPASSTLPHSFN